MQIAGEVDLQVEQVVCGGGTACDGAGDGPCNCDPCAGCSDGSTKWTGCVHRTHLIIHVVRVIVEIDCAIF